MRVKVERKRACLKVNIKKTKIMASDPINCKANWGVKGGCSDRYPLLGL